MMTPISVNICVSPRQIPKVLSFGRPVTYRIQPKNVLQLSSLDSEGRLMKHQKVATIALT